MGVRLPAEYQEVEWIGTSGTQIIDTDYLPIDGDEMSIELEFTAYSSSTSTYYCFAATDNSDPQVQLIFGRNYYGGVCYYKYFSTGEATKLQGVNFTTGKRYQIEIASNGDITCDGHSASPVNNLGYATGHLRFFARMAGNINFYGRLYKFAASHGGIVKVNLVPCYRKSDGEAGLYDLISDVFYTNTGTGEFLVGPDVIDSISPLMVAWRRIMMAAASVAKKLVKLIATSATGIVSFDTNVEMPTKVICEFSPVQEGTGDPSPDNVRPISGWTGCEIGHTGKNLFDGTVTNARIQNGVVIATGSYRLSEYIRVKPDTSYALVDKDGNLSQIFSHFFDANKTFLQSITTTEGIVVSPSGASYMRFHVTSRAFGDQKPFMLFEGSTAADYEPYQGATLPITFTDPSTGDPMTVYGGTVTLNEDGSADLVSEMAKFKLGDCSTYQQPVVGTSFAVQIFKAQIRSIGNATLNSKTGAISDQLKEIRGYFYSREPDRVATDYGYPCFAFQTANQGVYSDYFAVYIEDTQYTTAADFKEAVKDIEICVIRPESQWTTYHFDNIGQLQSFLGTNNIWHNMNGSITAEYYKKQ